MIGQTAQGPLTPVNELELGRPLRAHDIRKLAVCGACLGIGYRPHMLTLTLEPNESICPPVCTKEGDDGCHWPRDLCSACAARKPSPYHGVCVLKMHSHEQVLALPASERSKLRLGETGVELMRKLMDAPDRGTA